MLRSSISLDLSLFYPYMRFISSTPPSSQPHKSWVTNIIGLIFPPPWYLQPTLSPLWDPSHTWETTTDPYGTPLNVVRTIIIRLRGPRLDYTCQQPVVLGFLKLPVHSGWLLCLPTASNHFLLTKVWTMGSYPVSTSILDDYHTLPHTSNRLRW